MPCAYVNILYVQYVCNLKSALWVECKCLNMGLKAGLLLRRKYCFSLQAALLVSPFLLSINVFKHNGD